MFTCDGAAAMSWTYLSTLLAPNEATLWLRSTDVTRWGLLPLEDPGYLPDQSSCAAPSGTDNRRRGSLPVGGRSRESLNFCCSRPRRVTSPAVQFFSERRSVGPGGPERLEDPLAGTGEEEAPDPCIGRV